jgi:hypothetical protein
MTVAEIDLEPVYKAIAARLKTLGPHAYDYVPGASEWPGFFLQPPMIDPEGLADDWCVITLEIVLIVSGAFDINQKQIMPYTNLTGPKSVWQAFRAEPTLGGLVGDIRITGSRPLGYEEQAGYQGFGVVFDARAMIG